jgi:hypothetical protein
MANGERIASSARGDVSSCQYSGGGMKSILDRSFQYTPSVETDLKKTFVRIRLRLKEQEQARALADAEAKAKVSQIMQGKSAVSA